MTTREILVRTFAFGAGALASVAVGAPTTYTIDPNHTYPSFEADHMGGLSSWRGKFNNTTGTIVLDKEGQTGSVDVKIDAASIDFGHERMNTHAKSKDMFDAEQFPTATYTGKLVGFKSGAPTGIDGTLTLHGVSKPVQLTINKFLCKPVRGRETCGADASATINREDFGVSYGKNFGFNMTVTLQIQVEAAVAQAAASG
jgi:polyisoprenoid-binding protein YceI